MQLGWVDFSSNDRVRTLEVIRLLSEEDTLDELGIGTIRDKISETFFPGTSTTHTRAKYFFIVPLILSKLEAKVSAQSTYLALRKELEKIERDVTTQLAEKGKEHDGLIGISKINGGWVKHGPTELYWASLKKYGFIPNNMTLSRYIKNLIFASNESQEKFGARLRDNQDNYDAGNYEKRDVLGERLRKLLKSNYNLSMELTKDQAGYLKEQIINNYPQQLLSIVLKNKKLVNIFLSCKNFNELSSVVEKINQEELSCQYNLARNLSEFIYVLRIIYNQIISENEIGKKELKNLDLSIIAKKLDITELFNRFSFENNMLRNFLEHSQNAMKKNNRDELIELIKRREKNIKGEARAKTCFPDKNKYTKWVGGDFLHFRFFQAKRMIGDIAGKKV